MKVIYIALFSLMATVSWGQNKEIFNAIQQGAAEKMVSMMDESVEVCFDERVDFLSKQEAKKVLRQFFKEHPPKSFERVHRGNSPGADSKYTIGKYTSTSGKKFRVYIFVKKGKNQQLVQELRFDTL